MESKEIARIRVLQLIDNREPAAICAEAKFHLKPNTVPRWRNGSLSTFMNILPEIAKEYGVSTDWLLGLDHDATPDMIDVPIIGSIRAGYPVETYQVENGSVKIPAHLKPSGELYALDVVGDSMSPVVLDGDVIICEKISTDKVNGKICVITVDGESTLKKVKVDKNSVTLVPINPMYSEVRYTKSEVVKKRLTVDGVLVQLIRKF